MKTGLRTAWIAALACGGLAIAQPAAAHINMEGALEGRGGNQKVGPCEGKGRDSGPVYTFEPGATISLGVLENVGHDGYFRIAFDDDGDDDFKDPASIDPVNPNRYGTGKKCQGTAQDRCGKSDFCNVKSETGGATVLWDNLDPHTTSATNRKSWSWNVTLPNVECENCTLQVMQVMEDPPGHGPFDGQNDLYYRCVNIKLKRGVGKTPGTTTAPVRNNGLQCVKPSTDPTPTPDAGTPTPDAGTPTPDAGTPTRDAGSVDCSRPRFTLAWFRQCRGRNRRVSGDVPQSSLETFGEDEDEGYADDEGDLEASESGASVSEGGCSLARDATAKDAGWLLLALGALLARRGRKRDEA